MPKNVATTYYIKQKAIYVIFKSTYLDIWYQIWLINPSLYAKLV